MKNRSYLGESKTHYKMYKKGKNWVTMGVTLLSVGLGLEFGSAVKADNVNSSSNSNNNSIASKESSSSSLNSKVVKLNSSNSKESVQTTPKASSLNTSKTNVSVSNKQVAAPVSNNTPKIATPKVQATNFAVNNSNVSTYDGQTGQKVTTTGNPDFKNAKSMQIYLIDKGTGKVLDQREALWNPSNSKAYYGTNDNKEGVEFNAPNGDITVHPLKNYKFDIGYTEWFDSQRNGVTHTVKIGDDKTTEGYWAKQPTTDAITFSFENAMKVTNGTFGRSDSDAIQLFMSPISDNNQNTESHPTPQKDSYQVGINWVNTQYPENKLNSSDKVPDGQVVGQTVINFDYSNYNGGRDTVRSMYNAKTNPIGDYQVYAPTGYRFAYPNEVTASYLSNGQNGHVAQYSTYNQTGHFHWNNYQTVAKIYVTTDNTWKRPGNVSDGYVPMWKESTNTTPSKPATNNKPAASATPSKPETNNKPAANVTPSKPATNNKPAASATTSKRVAAEGLASSKRVAKKTMSKANRVIGTVNADQIKKSKSSEMRSAVNKSASLPVTGESSNSLKEIGLVMSSAVLGLLGLLGFTSEKKH